MKANPKYYLHRLNWNSSVAIPLLTEHNYLSLGWYQYATEDCKIFDILTSNNARKDFANEMRKRGRNMKTMYNLWIFSRYTVGDFVLTQLGASSNDFAICQIISEMSKIQDLELNQKKFKSTTGKTVICAPHALLNQDGTKIYDIGFIAKVKILGIIQRNDCSESLRTQLKYKRACRELHIHSDEIPLLINK